MLRPFCPSSFVICEHGSQYVEGLSVISLSLYGLTFFSGQLVISHKVPWECSLFNHLLLRRFMPLIYQMLDIYPPPPTESSPSAPCRYDIVPPSLTFGEVCSARVNTLEKTWVFLTSKKCSSIMHMYEICGAFASFSSKYLEVPCSRRLVLRINEKKILFCFKLFNALLAFKTKEDRIVQMFSCSDFLLVK
jgi:hypothetical protein